MRSLALSGVAVAAALAGCSRTAMDLGRVVSSDDAAKGSSTTAPPDASTRSDAATGAADARPVSDLPAKPAEADALWAADTRSATDLPAERTATGEDCIIAVRTDVCCGKIFVISRHEMDEDPCIRPYYGDDPPAPECVARLSPPSCRYLDCYSLPLTRIAGRGQDGTCQFLSECETDTDCVWALDVRACCGCPAYYPRSLLATDRCLGALEPGSSTDCPESVCAGVRCAEPTCIHRTGGCAAAPLQPAAGVKACTAF